MVNRQHRDDDAVDRNVTIQTPPALLSRRCFHFVELRKRLVAKGHRFRAFSDTEVVLRGYLEWASRNG